MTVVTETATTDQAERQARADQRPQLETAREFWRLDLLAGGLTEVPRWSDSAKTAVAVHELAVPPDVCRQLAALGTELEVPVSSVLLAAHAKVLASLSGESEVRTGYVDRSPLPCRMTTNPVSWRALVLAAADAEAQVRRHADVDLDALRRELGLGEPPYEVEFDPHGRSGELASETVLRVGVDHQDDHLILRLHYRVDVLDADAAARVAGYHLTALTLALADPDAEHAQQSLLSADELARQLTGMSGPTRELPDARAHELFEQRVRSHPDVVAAVLGTQELTYAELNARANRIGRALLARGLRREDVVAVVTQRNLDWMASVLAIFKAGGTYLPIEPHFPADRIATTLTRAGCRLVLTEAGSDATLGEALTSLPAVEPLLIGTALAEQRGDEDLGVEVSPDQLAYIYFTSGSTGEPKGAMCEHVGMLNHLYAKIDDLEIGEGSVVAQTAPQCFDISLWQLVAGLLVGARTLVVPQEVILDVPRFVDTVVEGRVNVLQVVPSYLEAALNYLERSPRELADLRYVSVTGEAVKKELTQRWFATQPGIRLVNAYGLTETSDDTNHEVMDRVPETDRVPLGRPIANVRVYVVNEQLDPVPLGAPGQIVFSGICVGRGYVNDPDRTRQVFGTDPHRPGERLYQAGDFGRWLPGGKLEFLGRRDHQVKISGFRIEIGEIENTLLLVPGVRDAAVVVAERAGRGKHLVGYYSAQQPLDADVLRSRLGESLPAYMVPTVLEWQEQLPLTDNGKIDRKALTRQAAAAEPEERVDAPRTATERRVARAWSSVLGIAEHQVGRQDHFFDRGGSSLSAVKLAITLDRQISVKDVLRHPVLAEQASLLDTPSDQQGD
ncbi:MAG TPA: amino acid adenylation domain-containing protein [Propionibacteriaceae bacterium]|nr:amino acid adenylation domain-containing protein [Propionibacteriaceae bacterium]